MNTRSLAAVALLGLMLASVSGCSSDVKAYEKKPAPTGKPAALPPPPRLPQKPKKDGDAYTVFGLVHDIHNKVHAPEVKNKKVTVVGFITKTNMVPCTDDAKAVEENCVPKCAVPEDIKKGTEADCKAPAPTFWIADAVDEKKEAIAVMGWASNFAGIKGAIEEMDKETSIEKAAEVKFMDQQGRVIPNPLPAVGAKVKITCQYGFSSKVLGVASDPKYGILGCGNDRVIEVLQEAPEQASLPHMKERKKLKSEKK